MRRLQGAGYKRRSLPVGVPGVWLALVCCLVAALVGLTVGVALWF